jgi:adenosylcobinamide-phosphate synthase
MSWPPALTLALAVPLAWAIDARFGEPRDAWHPVAWLGRALAPMGRGLRQRSPAPAFVGGAVVWLVGAGAIAWFAWALQAALIGGSASPWFAVPLLALLLKPTFAWRMLRDEAAAVEAALADEGVDAARVRLARLVSRDVRVLDADLIRETTIETIAENLNDSVVAPLFWYALFGLPGAAVYRFANTLDAMWGYRGAWEWAGKWSARADDVLSWLPARITALLLLPTPRLFEQARQTPSPNSGWPMGAMALRLGVRLRKPGVYELNGDAPSPRAEQVRLALAQAGWVADISVVLVVLAWMARLA